MRLASAASIGLESEPVSHSGSASFGATDARGKLHRPDAAAHHGFARRVWRDCVERALHGQPGRPCHILGVGCAAQVGILNGKRLRLPESDNLMPDWYLAEYDKLAMGCSYLPAQPDGGHRKAVARR